MIVFFDASALVKRYVEEEGSSRVRRLFRETVAVSRLSAVEIASALARRTREGDLSARDRDRLLAALARDLEGLHVVELTAAVAEAATAHLARHPLRAGDAVQLASATLVRDRLRRPVQLLSFDDRLTRAGEAEGLTSGDEPR